MKVSCQTNCTTGTMPAFDFHLSGFSCNTHSPPHHPYLQKPFRLQNYENFSTHLRSSSKPPGRHPLDREGRRAGRHLSKSPPESCHFVNRVEVKTKWSSVSRLCCLIWARGEEGRPRNDLGLDQRPTDPQLNAARPRHRILASLQTARCGTCSVPTQPTPAPMWWISYAPKQLIITALNRTEIICFCFNFVCEWENSLIL